MSIEQGVLIDNLNSYLKWQNISLTLDEEGICNGLVLVHAKYVLEGKEAQFFEILKAVSKKQDIGNSDEVNQFIVNFVTEVLLSYQPKNYCKHISQAHGSRMLKVNNQYLESAFDFALAAKDKAWEEILQQLQLQDREVLQIASADHVVSVYKTGSSYVLYDPNYGRQVFKNEKALIKTLHNKCFAYKNDHMGLELHLIRHPDDRAIPRPLPDIKALYNQCFHPLKGKPLADINATTVTGWGKKFRTLSAAAVSNHADIIDYLVAEGAHGLYDAGRFAVYNDNAQALDVLLPKIKERAEVIHRKYLQTPDAPIFPKKVVSIESKVLAALAFDALLFGSHEAYKAIMTELPVADIEALKYRLVLDAANGGNELSLKDCLRRLDPYDFERPVDSKGTTLAEALMEKAIQSQSAASVQMLMDLNFEYREEKKAAFLVEAIAQNNYVTVDKLLDNPGFTVDGISLSTRGASQTALPILKSLQAHGMEFSENIQIIMKKKSHHQSISVSDSLGIVFNKFTDFLREVFGRQRAISYDANFFKKPKVNAEEVERLVKDEDDLPPMEQLPF